MKTLVLFSLLLLCACESVTESLTQGSQSDGFVMLPDTTKPKTSIETPEDGINLFGSTSSLITVNATDDREVTKVEIYKDKDLLTTLTEAPYSYSWDTTGVKDGSYKLQSFAYDSAGNVGKSVSITVQFLPPDITAPVTVIIAPVTASTVSGKAVSISATAIDDRGVANVDLFINGKKTSLSSSVAGVYSYSWDSTAVDNGSYSLQTKAYDAAGNEGVSPIVTVKVDNDKVAPVTAVTDPDNGNTVSGKVVIVNATATDNVKVESVDLYINDVKIPLAESSAGKYSYSWDSTKLANGAHKLQTKAYDAKGNEGVSSVVTVTVYNDNVPPVTIITAPATASTVSGKTVSITATATDNKSVTDVQLYVNGTLSTLVSATGSSPYLYTWDTTVLTNGNYTLQTKAYDAVGNVGQSTIVTVKVENDKIAPVTAVTAPVTGSSVLGKTVSVSLTATDNVGIKTFEFYLNETLTPVITTAAGNYSYTWDTTVIDNGSYTLQSKAYDEAGNVGVSAVVTVTVNNDKQAPVTAITAPANASTVSGTAVIVTATATDNVGVKTIEFLLDGVKTPLVAGAAGQYSYTWDTSKISNGTYTLQTKATDEAGNVGVSAVVSVAVYNDNIPPVTAITSPTTGASVSGTVTITATATDNVGVARVELYRDGVLLTTDTTLEYAFTWNTTQVANGAHTLYTKAYDAAGNVGVSTTISVSVYNQEYVGPAVAITAPVNGSNVTGTNTHIEVTATDASGVTTVELYLDGVLLKQNMSTTTNTLYTYLWNTTLVSNGSHTLLAKAYDVYGNVGTSNPVVVNVYNEVTDNFTQTVAKKELEILWVVDNSVSMDDEQEALSSNFESFINQFITSRDVPFRMGITKTTPGCYSPINGLLIPESDTKLNSTALEQNQTQFIDDFKSMIKVGTTYDDCAGIESGLHAVEGFLQRYSATHVKRDTYLAIVILTDESDKSSKTAEEYVNLFRTYKDSQGLIKVYTICDVNKTNFGPGISLNDRNCDKDTLASQLTSGVVSNIYGDFASDLSTLGKNLTTLVDSHALSRVPTPGSLKVFVNDEEETDYSYDAATNSIKFNAGSIPTTGAAIRVVYTPM
ncbi:MAG TPA: Ig-like domain-containing protein [Bacteriovoracaceae bacterium]|nr:Ig-like domain-containing protein [Bacteriovoracaceae bacterium]